MTGRSLWFVVPEGIDDPARVSGGSVYDQRLRDGLGELGWDVRMVEADASSDALLPVPDRALALVDGLVALRAPGAVEAAAARASVVLLAHMVAASFPDPDPRDVDAELRVLRAARFVITTSEWARGELIARGAAPDAVTAAVPGSDAAARATGTSTGTALLCVGAVAPHKGQDTLVEALTRLPAEAQWTCTFAGSTAADSAFARAVADRAAGSGLAGRITWTGVLDRGGLGDAYAAADLVVAPSRAESYGIAIGEALSRGIPVIASRVGGIPEAVAPGGGAMLVPPGDPAALADALRGWIADPELRTRLTDGAWREAPTRPRWRDTARAIDAILRGAS